MLYSRALVYRSDSRNKRFDRVIEPLIYVFIFFVSSVDVATRGRKDLL